MRLNGSEYACDWSGEQSGKTFYRFVPMDGWNRVYMGIGETEADAWRNVLTFDTEEAREKVAA